MVILAEDRFLHAPTRIARERFMTKLRAVSRRHIIQGLTVAASFAFAGPAVAARLITTPHQMTGPFYPEDPAAGFGQ